MRSAIRARSSPWPTAPEERVLQRLHSGGVDRPQPRRRGLEALGVEHVKPLITRGILVDIAGYKGVTVLDSRYEVTLADVRGALGKQALREDSIEPGDAILFNYGWAVHWNNPQRYNDSRFFVGDNQGSPGIGVEVARWAVEKKASMVGADSCCVTIQPPTRPELGNVHHELLLAAFSCWRTWTCGSWRAIACMNFSISTSPNASGARPAHPCGQSRSGRARNSAGVH